MVKGRRSDGDGYHGRQDGLSEVTLEPKQKENEVKAVKRAFQKLAILNNL